MPAFRPYQPSWVNTLLEWINKLPFHPFLFYLGLYLASVLITHATLWTDGSAAPGQWLSAVFFDMIWVPFGLGALHFIQNAATTSVDEIRPVLETSKAEFEALKYRFLTYPFWPVLVLSLAGFTLGVFLGSGELPLATTNLSKTAWGIMAGAGYTFLPLFFFAAWRYIRQIIKIYSHVGMLNLFDLQPFYGLARVAMVIAGFLVLLANMNYVWEVLLGLATMTAENAALLSILTLSVALVAALVPLWGIHNKIEAEKQAQLAINAREIKKLHQLLHTGLSKKTSAEIDKLQSGLSALYAARASVTDVPAWPWRPGAFRNFASAIFLPLLLLVLERLISRFF
ncbi:MAG: hypothetical protein KIS85_07310 [Anaerolineales bacterium]|nr:hypothetical protein [Anaerolineales bacterium]